AARRYRRDLGLRLRLPGVARRTDVLCRPGRPRPYPRPPRLLCQARGQPGAGAGAAAVAPRGRGARLRFAGAGGEGGMTARPYPWEKSYGPGLSWDAPIATSTVPAL